MRDDWAARISAVNWAKSITQRRGYEQAVAEARYGSSNTKLRCYAFTSMHTMRVELLDVHIDKLDRLLELVSELDVWQPDEEH